MKKEFINEFVKAIDRESGVEMKAKVRGKVVEITTEVVGRVFQLPRKTVKGNFAMNENRWTKDLEIIAQEEDRKGKLGFLVS